MASRGISWSFLWLCSPYSLNAASYWRLCHGSCPRAHLADSAGVYEITLRPAGKAMQEKVAMMYQLWVSHNGPKAHEQFYKTVEVSRHWAGRPGRCLRRCLASVSPRIFCLMSHWLNHCTTASGSLPIICWAVSCCFIFWKKLCWGLREPATLQDIFTVAGWWLQPMDSWPSFLQIFNREHGEKSPGTFYRPGTTTLSKSILPTNETQPKPFEPRHHMTLGVQSQTGRWSNIFCLICCSDESRRTWHTQAENLITLN